MTIWMQLAIVCPLMFLAGFIDSIAGGGALISIPAFMMAGLPPIMASATNKFAATFGATSSSIQYIRGGYINKKLIPVSVVTAVVGSVIGAQIALALSQQALQTVMFILIPAIAVFTVVKKDMLDSPGEELEHRQAQMRMGIVAFLIGSYDGFLGPGTGTFMLMALVGFVKMDAITANGNVKVTNLSSNIAALITYIITGKVVFALGIPCLFCSVAGNFLGARLAMKKGIKVIKPILLVVVTLLMLSLGKDLLVMLAASRGS